jgi:hypothetical protein
MSNTTAASSMVSKRAALYEPKVLSDEPKQAMPILNRPTISPSKFANKTRDVLKDHSPVDDIEMFSTSPTSSSSSSSSSSSASSYKENKRPSPPQNLIEKLNNLNNQTSSDMSSSGGGGGSHSSKEPSKLSLSEKMKLFSVGSGGGSSGLNNYNNTLQATGVNDATTSVTRQKSLNKRNFNRFQTQVVFSCILF